MHISRRNAIIGAGLGAAFPKTLLAAGNDVNIDNLNISNFDMRAIRHLARVEKLLVPTYRFGLVVRSGISASGSAGSVTSQASADLVGLDFATIRRVARRAHEDLMAKLRTTGRTIIGPNEARASNAYKDLILTPQPFGKSPFADARYAIFGAPDGMDLIMTHFDSPMTDQSPFALTNWRALNQISVDTNSVILLPTMVLDFAQYTGSGHKVYSNSASIGIRTGLYLSPMLTNLGAYHARIRIAGELGRANLKETVTIGTAGELVQTSSRNNNAEVQWWNSQVNSGNLAPGTIGPSLAYSFATYQYRTNPQIFEQIAFDASQSINRVFAEAANTMKP